MPTTDGFIAPRDKVSIGKDPLAGSASKPT